MASTIRILIAVAVGIIAGALMASMAPAEIEPVVGVARTLGDLWLDALRMTVVPMIFTMVVTGLGGNLSGSARGGTALRALLAFAIMLLGAAVFGVALMTLILMVFPIPAGAGSAIQTALAGGHETSPLAPPPGDWLRGFVPANPVRAAADSAICPLLVFSLAFGLAVTQIALPLRTSLLKTLDAIFHTLLVIVASALKAAPLGVACLAFVAAARAGFGTAEALLHYALTGALLCVIVVLVLYPLTVLLSGISFAQLANAAGPAQLLAFSTQSSIGALPAMVEATTALGGEPAVRQVVLPLAVSFFRLGSAASGGAIAIYVARLSGGSVSPMQAGTAACLSATVSFAATGLPSQSSFVTLMSPICLAVGAPLQALVLLMAVDSLPDAFRSVANVTSGIAVTTISARRAAKPPATA